MAFEDNFWEKEEMLVSSIFFFSQKCFQMPVENLIPSRASQWINRLKRASPKKKKNFRSLISIKNKTLKKIYTSPWEPYEVSCR